MTKIKYDTLSVSSRIKGFSSEVFHSASFGKSSVRALIDRVNPETGEVSAAEVWVGWKDGTPAPTAGELLRETSWSNPEDGTFGTSWTPFRITETLGSSVREV